MIKFHGLSPIKISVLFIVLVIHFHCSETIYIGYMVEICSILFKKVPIVAQGKFSLSHSFDKRDGQCFFDDLLAGRIHKQLFAKWSVKYQGFFQRLFPHTLKIFMRKNSVGCLEMPFILSKEM